MTSKVQVEVKAPVATITLNKPERLNALDLEVWEGLRDAAEAVDAASGVRAVILQGAGGAFCAGLDVKAGSTLGAVYEAPPAVAIPKIRAHLGHLQECFTRLERVRVPVIAAIERVCMGAGMELALCCDIRIAAEGTVFSIPEVQLGIIPDMGGTQRLPRAIGVGMAKELIYSARRWADVICRDELMIRAESEPGFRLYLTLTREMPPVPGHRSGRIERMLLDEALAGFGGTPPKRAFICGATAFVEVAAMLLIEAGFPFEKISTERYGGDPATGVGAVIVVPEA